MSDSLRQYIDNIYRIFDGLDEVGLGISSMIPEIEDKESKSLLRRDAVMFMLYLAASDGDISYSESYFIGEYFGIHMSTNNMRETIRENNIYSHEFESRVPMTVQMMVEADNRIVHDGTMDSTGSRMIYDFFKLVGQSFIACDNAVGEREIEDLACYLDNIKQYINKNALTRAKVISDPNKDARDASKLVVIYKNNTYNLRATSDKGSYSQKDDNSSNPAPWDTVYYDYACPYCGKYKVRLAKWEDKRFSAAFWGFYSYKLHCRFKCDACKSMWN